MKHHTIYLNPIGIQNAMRNRPKNKKTKIPRHHITSSIYGMLITYPAHLADKHTHTHSKYRTDARIRSFRMKLSPNWRLVIAEKKHLKKIAHESKKAKQLSYSLARIHTQQPAQIIVNRHKYKRNRP